MSMQDWLDMSADDFVALHVPAVAKQRRAEAAARAAAEAAHRRARLAEIHAGIQHRIATTDNPTTSAPSSRAQQQEEQEMNDQNARREHLRRLMNADPSEVLVIDGKRVQVGDALARMLRGETAEVSRDVPPRSDHMLTPSARAMASLTPEQRAAFDRDGTIPGLGREVRGADIKVTEHRPLSFTYQLPSKEPAQK